MSLNVQIIVSGLLLAILSILGIGGVQYAIRAHDNAVTAGVYGQMSTILASAVEYYVVEGNVGNSKWLTADACTAIPASSLFSKQYPSIPTADQYGHPFEICYFPATTTGSEDFAVYDSNTGGTGTFPGFTLNNVTYSANLSASSTTPFAPSSNPPITCGNSGAKPNACVTMADDESAGNLAE